MVGMSLRSEASRAAWRVGVFAVLAGCGAPAAETVARTPGAPAEPPATVASRGESVAAEPAVWAYDDTVSEPLPDAAPDAATEDSETAPIAIAPPATPIDAGITTSGDSGQAALATRAWPVARSVAGYEPRAAIELSEAPSHPWNGTERRSAHYVDILQHTPAAERWFRSDVRLTSVAHETHHGLQLHVSRTRRDHSFFYFRNGVGAFVPTPRTGLRPLRTLPDGTVVKTADDYTASPHIVAELPAKAIALADTRYQLYLATPDRRTYGVLLVFNEWNAYLADARVGLELHRAGYYGNTFVRTDLLAGPVDFLYFGSAAMVALSKREPQYWAENRRQLEAVYALFAEETMALQREGRGIETFKGFHDDELLAHFLTSADNAPMRAFLTGWLGAEFTGRVFGF